jgi:transposase
MTLMQTVIKAEPDDRIIESAVRMTLTSGLPRTTVANDLGVGIATLDAWVRDAMRQMPHRETFEDLIREVETLRAASARLTRENAALTREVALLKRTVVETSARIARRATGF